METEKILEKESLTVKVSGHVDATTAPALEKLVAEDANKVTKIVFDFARVEYISSAGLRVLLGTHKLMASKGGEFVLENVTEDVKSILEMTGFLGFLKVR